MTVRPAVVAVVVAGGSGERFGRRGGKQLLQLAGRPVAYWSVAACAAARSIDRLVVVCHPDRLAEYEDALAPAAGATAVSFVAGGETRQHSVSNGVAQAAEGPVEIVVVHDGARPLVSPALIDDAVNALWSAADLDGVIVGHPVSDTLKLVVGGTVDSTPDRSRFWAVQTPQVFRFGALRDALASAAAEAWVGTDDASVVERFGGRVGLVEGPRDNMKITVAEDAVIAEAILRFREEV